MPQSQVGPDDTETWSALKLAMALGGIGFVASPAAELVATGRSPLVAVAIVTLAIAVIGVIYVLVRRRSRSRSTLRTDANERTEDGNGVDR